MYDILGKYAQYRRFASGRTRTPKALHSSFTRTSTTPKRRWITFPASTSQNVTSSCSTTSRRIWARSPTRRRRRKRSPGCRRSTASPPKISDFSGRSSG
ncbi:hypothetical protein COP1_038937 [Malus domestica]